MTRRGLGFSIVTALVYLAANQTRVGWLYLIAAAMLAVLGLSCVLAHVWGRGLSVERNVDQPVHEGDEAGVRLALRKRGWPAYLLVLRERCPLDASDRSFVVPQADAAGVAFDYRAQCRLRGRYSLPTAEIESPGLLGLFRARTRVGTSTSVAVYPWFLPEAEWMAARRRSATEVPSQRAGAGASPLGTRAYRPGDPLRHVHWRSSARRGELVVKEFEDEREAGLAIVLDTSRSLGTGRDSTLEYSIKLAASLARYAYALGRPFRVLAWPASGQALAWTALLEYLADLQVDPSAPRIASLVSRAASGETLILASPDLEGASAALLAHQRRGGRCLAVSFSGFPGAAPPPAGIPAVPWPAGADPVDAVRQVIEAL